MKISLIKLIILTILVSFFGIESTNSYFVDQVVITDNIVTAGDWTCPYVEITSPQDNEALSGQVEIRGTVTDNAPHHYWLVVQDDSGSTFAGPGVVLQASSFIDTPLFTWDTTNVPNGDYTIKLEARDAFGNKCPDLAPVPEDPGDPNDSVHWIQVRVNNTTNTTSANNPLNIFGNPGTLANLNLNSNPNPTTVSTELDFYLMDENRAVGFKLEGDDLSAFDNITYEISYDSDSQDQAIVGEMSIDGKDVIEVNDLVLGTCSSGGTCVYHTGINQINLTVILEGPIQRTLSKTLTL